jgi:ATP-dependent DNA helicase RecG
MLQVVDAGGQAAFLAPTEVLATQHARTLRSLLGALGTRVALLTGSQGAAARRENLRDAADGSAGIVVGTHSLLSQTVQFADLGLVVIDEQHRFGVEQRDALRAKGARPHLLVMTATPIPRTVAMTVFGDLETSTLAEVPAGRSGVVTHVVPAANGAWMDRAWRRVREEVDASHRVYVVCPRIDQDDPDPDGADLLAPDRGEHARRPLRAVLEVVVGLRALPALAGVEIAVLHGRMAAADKERVLAQFAAGEVQVLVATTVIEVGVDVTQATGMVVLDADRYGLSQLHQLRGRVGRGSAPGVCLLVSGAHDASPAARRLATLAATTDGFVLAALDLELRREGDVLGAAQSGPSSLGLLRVTRDADLIARARVDATGIVDRDPTLAGEPALREAIARQLAGERAQFLDRS